MLLEGFPAVLLVSCTGITASPCPPKSFLRASPPPVRCQRAGQQRGPMSPPPSHHFPPSSEGGSEGVKPVLCLPLHPARASCGGVPKLMPARFPGAHGPHGRWLQLQRAWTPGCLGDKGPISSIVPIPRTLPRVTAAGPGTLDRPPVPESHRPLSQGSLSPACGRGPSGSGAVGTALTHQPGVGTLRQDGVAVGLSSSRDSPSFDFTFKGQA